MSVMNFEDLKTACRICLNKREVLILLNNRLYGDRTHGGPLISNILAYIMCTQIVGHHPEGICLECLDQVKQAHLLRLKFEKSQQVLREYEQSIIVSYKKDDNFEVYEIDDVSNNSMFPGPKNNTCVKTDQINNNAPVTCVKKEILNKTVCTQNGENQNEGLESLENCAQINEKSEFNIKKTVKLQRNGSIERSNVQVRCVDVNKFIIENKPQNCNLPSHEKLNTIRIPNKLIKWKCPTCCKLYSKGKLKKHVLICRTLNVNSLTCKECNKLFSKIKYLNFHIKLAHSSDPPIFPCKICGFLCKNSSARQVHTRQKHGGTKSHMCDTCGKGFYHNANLLRHKSKHTKETQEVCNVCGKSFHYQGALFYHMKIHTNERNYLCNLCDKKYYTKQSLQRHMDTHTGDRRFKCKFCVKSFCSASEKRRHEMIHTGERPYHCMYCTKSFSSRYNHDVHKSKHRGDQPCKFCTKKFLNEEVVSLHTKLKHRMKLQGTADGSNFDKETP